MLHILIDGNCLNSPLSKLKSISNSEPMLKMLALNKKTHLASSDLRDYFDQVVLWGCVRRTALSRRRGTECAAPRSR